LPIDWAWRSNNSFIVLLCYGFDLWRLLLQWWEYSLKPPMLLKSTTRHIRIFTAEVDNNELVPSESVLTLDIDPDNELLWSEDSLQKVYTRFDELVESHSGEELTEYNLRRIGSDLEHFVRSLLQSGEITYNLNSRVVNYSLGLPRLDTDDNHLR
jgi:NAD(P)H-quinone oxidoreductase subunit M